LKVLSPCDKWQVHGLAGFADSWIKARCASLAGASRQGFSSNRALGGRAGLDGPLTNRGPI
jgi:hypothetical protein